MIIKTIINNLNLIRECRKGLAVSTLLQWLLIIGGLLALLALLAFLTLKLFAIDVGNL